MKRLTDPFFISYVLIWLIVHGLRKMGIIIPVVNDHLTDLVAVPAMSHCCIVITQLFFVKDPKYTYPLSYLLFIAAYLSVVFEWLMPRYSAVYTGDLWDVPAYFLGSFFYYFVHGRWASACKTNHSLSV